MQTHSVSTPSPKTSRQPSRSSSESSSSPRSPHQRLVKQARCTNLAQLCPNIQRSVSTATPTIRAEPRKSLDRNRPQRKKELVSPRKPGVPVKSARRTDDTGSHKTVRASVAFAPMPTACAAYNGIAKPLGVQSPTRRSVADRAELVSRDLPFQAPVLVATEARRFETQSTYVNRESTITALEYADHGLNMRLLNYLPRDKELLALSRVAVECINAIGAADAIFNGKTARPVSA